MGNSLTLTCNYNPHDSFHSWVHPTQGSLSQSNGRLTITTAANSHQSSLTVVMVTFDDQGEYTCNVMTESSSLLSQTITAVLYERVQITTETLLSYQTRQCDPVMLRCSAMHHESVTWRKESSDGFLRDVTNSSDGRITVLPDQLVIHEAKLSDNGTYTCIANNRVSNDYITAILHIGNECHNYYCIH